jgi:hypothetical protein
MLVMDLTGWLEHREREALAYLVEENRLLRRQLGGRRLDRDRKWSGLDSRRYFPTRCSTSLLFSWQMYSINSPRRSDGRVVNDQGLENVFGSSMVCSISR